MGFKFTYQESGSVELTSPSPKELGYYLAKAGCNQDQIFKLGNMAIKAKGPAPWGPVDAGNGVIVERRTENRRRVYTITWNRAVKLQSPTGNP